jgi:nitroimidazol reductase NimA-like FMN-containing flavoprotein (pyridoxamine 5'-phosphate oxidase superfamily)
VGVALTPTEAWARLETAHTGILVTLRADGRPVPLPVWFVALGPRVYVRTPARSRKVANIGQDPRSSFLVESGTSWPELCAVLLQTEARVVVDPREAARATAALERKYAGHRHGDDVPTATRAHYAGAHVVLALEPVGEPVSWDNRRLRSPRPATSTDP